MIKINFYINGFVIEGHDDDEICAVVSYASSSCINNCLIYDSDLKHHQEQGLTYMLFHCNCDEIIQIYALFKINLTKWCNDLYTDKVIINNHDQVVDVEE